MQKQFLIKSWITNASYNQVCQYVIEWAKRRESSYVCIANVHMLVEALFDNEFNNLLNKAVIATPDGKPLSVLMNWLYGTHQERITGPDLMLSLLTQAAQEKIPVFFYGATEETLSQLTIKLENDYPDLILAGTYCPPFRPLTEEEDAHVINRINASKAGLVFVALGCPKQERWMAAHQGQINAVMLGVGAAFNFYTGQLQRAPQWMQQLSLEWLFRLMKEPVRLFRRYFVTNSCFLLAAFKQWIMVKGFGKTVLPLKIVPSNQDVSIVQCREGHKQGVKLH